MEPQREMMYDLLQASALILLKQTGKPYDLGAFNRAYNSVSYHFFDSADPDIWAAAAVIRDRTLGETYG